MWTITTCPVVWLRCMLESSVKVSICGSVVMVPEVETAKVAVAVAVKFCTF